MAVNVIKPLLHATAIGIVSGLIFGVALGIKAYHNALERAEHLPYPEAASMLCSAGEAPFLLGILGIPAGALIGLVLGGGLLLYSSKGRGRRLP